MKKKAINIGLIFFIFIMFSTYVILKSEIFSSKNIVVTGNETIKSDIIIEMSKISQENNIFEYNVKDIEELIYDNKYIEDVEVKRKLPNTIEINIKEKNIDVVITNGDNYYYIDKNMEIIDKVEESEVNKLDKIIMKLDYKIKDNEIIELKNDKNKDKIIELINCINAEGITKKVEYIDMNLENIEICSSENTNFIISRENNLEYDLKRINQILIDLQNKSKSNGIVDLTNDKYAIYTP